MFESSQYLALDFPLTDSFQELGQIVSCNGRIYAMFPSEESAKEFSVLFKNHLGFVSLAAENDSILLA